MTTQEIQIIASTVDKLGVAGKETVLYWILAGNVIQPIIVCCCIFAIVYMITKAIYNFNTKENRYYEQLRKISSAAEMSMDFYESELNCIIRWIELGKKIQQQKIEKKK